MSKIDLAFIELRARAIKVQCMIAGDENGVAKADLLLAQCAGRVQELDAAGTRRAFAAGSVVEKALMGAGQLSGIASSEDLDHYGHRIKRGAFTESIRRRGLKGAQGVKLLLDHDHTKPAGTITRLAYNNNGQLEIDVMMALEVSYARDRYEAIKAAGGYSFSVGFRVEDYEVIETRNDTQVLIKSGDLHEVSLVAFPGNDAATLNLAAPAPTTQEGILADILGKLRQTNQLLKG